MQETVVVIGAGINGLVAANYLQREGYQVTVLERQSTAGGACSFGTFEKDGSSYQYPSAATVLGFMQDFVYRETGLAERLAVHAPHHPAVVWFQSQAQPCIMFGDREELKREVADKWGETGNLDAYYDDLERVRNFLTEGYRAAKPPTLEEAHSRLGSELTQRWIAGSAADLMHHYFSSEKMKVFCSLDVTESGPVSLYSPYSAFTIPLMASGSVFGGEWGFVKGGLWRLTEELSALNAAAGIQMITAAQVMSVSTKDLTVSYIHYGKNKTLSANYVIFATDPESAACVLNNAETLSSCSSKRALGTSGKLVMFFRKPVIWKDDSGATDFDSAFKFIIAEETLAGIETAAQAVAEPLATDFVPGYFEIYCEGAAMRKLGTERGYDCLSIFFKNMSFARHGEELPAVRDSVQAAILSRISNCDDLIDSILFSPLDLSERFLFPKGNIDHIELCADQTYFARTFSPTPATNFYQFGPEPKILYAAAGSYPCGSIAGTAGYMCARQLTRSKVYG